MTTGTFICSLCCGESRDKEKCEGCSFAQASLATRNYKDVPYFSTQEMADSLALEDIARVIESGLCQVWRLDKANVNDRTAARLVELMLDRYHFNDAELPITDPVLAAVYRSIHRRTMRGQGYLQFVSQFTGY